MSEDGETTPLAGAMALEHLTGPSRGRVTWLNGPELDISIGSNRMLRIDESRSNNDREGLLAQLHLVDGSYEIEAADGQSIWINGNRLTNKVLDHRDMIEFGEVGPLSRFCVYRGEGKVHRMVGDILSDGLVYMRVSRRPWLHRLASAVLGVVRRLLQETTLLFRASVVLAIVGLATLAWTQNRLNVELEKRIEHSASRLEGFAGVLARAREEALTPADLRMLRQDLANRMSTNAERLAELERRSGANVRVIADSIPSVLFLQGAYGFREASTGRMLRHVVGDSGQPLISPVGRPLLSLDGSGPVAERQFTGTGFAVGKRGAIITNRHVARPWENDANIGVLVAQGLEPVMIKYISYVPGKQAPKNIEVATVSEKADLAVLRYPKGVGEIPGLKLAETPPAAGDEIIVMGFPTGLRSMLAQSGEDFIEELQQARDTGFWSVATRLAEKKLIMPLSSRGIVSQVTSSTVVYDAETTHGGSGGPVLDVSGAVVAVNTAILPEYGGSNLGVPVADVRALLEAAEMY